MEQETNLQFIYTNSKISKLILEIKKAISGTKWESHVWIVGGVVRDNLLGRDSRNLDLCVDIEDGAIDFAQWLSTEYNCNNSKMLSINTVYHTAQLQLGTIHELSDIIIMITDSRRTISVTNGVTCGTIDEDALTRDFTINALYANVSTNKIIDPTHKGINDLKNKIIRAATTPDKTIEINATRLLRCVRFATILGFQIHKDTWFALIKNAQKIKKDHISYVRNELDKILMSDKPSVGVKYLLKSGLLSQLIPVLSNTYGLKQEKEHENVDVFTHTLNVLDLSVNNLYVRYAALLHDIGKINTSSHGSSGVGLFEAHEKIGSVIAKGILSNLNFSEKELALMVNAIKYHNIFKSSNGKCPSNKAIRQFVSLVGKDNVTVVLGVIDANNKDRKTKYPNQVGLIINAITRIQEKEQKAKSNKMEIPVHGDDIMEYFKIGPCETVGILLKEAMKIVKNHPHITKSECLEKLKTSVKLSV